MSRSLIRFDLVGPFLLALFAFLVSSLPVTALETKAREAILIDFDTGHVLFQKDADKPMPPASMSKIMTSYLALERIKDGRLKLDDEIPVSEKAWRKGGSKMFIEVGKRVKVEDILRGIIIQSGNDAAIALAEALAGSEAAFADMMTEKARELGMATSTFKNATGWPDPGHFVTARELAILAEATIRHHPEYYSMYSERTFTYNKIRQGNRNPLIYKAMGADGLKTGHTEEAGYGLTASVKRGDRRLILVANGMKSVRERSSESERLLEWGFREYDNYLLLKKGEKIENAEVWLGVEPIVPLVSASDMLVTLPRLARKSMNVTVEYEGPIAAPIEAGQELATLRIKTGEGPDLVYPLQAGASVEQLGSFGRIAAALGHLVWGPGS